MIINIVLSKRILQIGIEPVKGLNNIETSIEKFTSTNKIVMVPKIASRNESLSAANLEAASCCPKFKLANMQRPITKMQKVKASKVRYISTGFNKLRISRNISHKTNTQTGIGMSNENKSHILPYNDYIAKSQTLNNPNGKNYKAIIDKNPYLNTATRPGSVISTRRKKEITTEIMKSIYIKMNGHNMPLILNNISRSYK